MGDTPSHEEGFSSSSASRITCASGSLLFFPGLCGALTGRFEWTCFAYAAAPNFTIPASPSPDSSLHPSVQRVLEMSPWKPTTLLHPAWIFVIFLVASMLPRALRAHKWYHETFGERYPKSRKAVIPWIL